MNPDAAAVSAPRTPPPHRMAAGTQRNPVFLSQLKPHSRRSCDFAKPGRRACA